MSRFQYHGIFDEINRLYAINTIKKQWIRVRYDPCYKLCYIVEMRKINTLYNEIGVSDIHTLETSTPDFTSMRLVNRKKDFIRALEKTKKYLKDNKKKIEFNIKQRRKFTWLSNSKNVKWKLINLNTLESKQSVKNS